MLMLLALLALPACDRQKADSQQGAAVEGVPVKGVDRSHAGKPFPDIAFGDPEGTQTSYEGFKGIPTLVNLWATWCAPCVKELPTLNALAKAKGADLWVVPISQDRGPHASVAAFLARLELDQLHAYHDPNMALSGALGAEILPTTILYNSEGKEVWRYVGDLDWTGGEAKKLLAEAR
ncbi:TlpA disulfide reductase family protein [Sphingomonas sp.]|uniref:TlpA family protein disulfide reductase n=1 Tax=Sphingomonas sp. TaxID=28214 RepID=UPI00286DD9BF|nr:TlpA disulfide reductase family protein [Sphingomonas sp.]